GSSARTRAPTRRSSSRSMLWPVLGGGAEPRCLSLQRNGLGCAKAEPALAFFLRPHLSGLGRSARPTWRRLSRGDLLRRSHLGNALPRSRRGSRLSPARLLPALVF